MRVTSSLLTLALVSLLCVAPTPARAVNVAWDSGGDGINWADGLNWSTDAVPGSADNVNVGAGRPLVRELEFFQASNLETGAAGGIDVRGTLNAVGASVINNGEIFIDNGAAAGPATLGVGAGTLQGTGKVILGDSDFANTGARLIGPSVGSATHAAGHAIRGEGTIAGNWINNGTILSEDRTGDNAGTLRIQGSMTNNGVLQTSATASLTATVNIAQGAAGQIIADGNKVFITDAGITGGTLKSLNGGLFEGNVTTSRLNGVHNQALINMTGSANGGFSGSTLRIEGSGIVNDGTIVMASDLNSRGYLVLAGPMTELAGSGEVILNRQDGGARIESADGSHGINGPNHTIRGVGNISAWMINNGTIIAEPRRGHTLLGITGSMTNNNIIRADAGSRLRLFGPTVTQNDMTGRIVANEGTVELGATVNDLPVVNGGRFETVGAGTVRVTYGTRIHNVTNQGVLNVQANASLGLGGTTFTNNGIVTLEFDDSQLSPWAADLGFRSNVTLGGTGEFVLAPTFGSDVHTISTGFNTATQAPGHTIRGEGEITGNGTFVNNGRIEGASFADDIEIRGKLGGAGTLKNVTIFGTHAPSPGATTIEGSYSIVPQARLEVDLGGTAPTQYDRLVSTDPMSQFMIDLSSTTLAVSLADLGNSYVPAAGDSFTLLSSLNPIDGEFSTISLPASGLGKTITWAPVDRTDPTKYILRIAAVSPTDGDFDGDGDVDGDDLLRGQRGQSPRPGHPGDLALWRQNFGAGGNATPVPEPSCGVLLALALIGGIATRRSF